MLLVPQATTPVLSCALLRWFGCLTRCGPQVVKVGIVGGSDLVKIQEQLGDNGRCALPASAGCCCLVCCWCAGTAAVVVHPATNVLHIAVGKA
jgi:hypothetical protein